MHRELLLLGVLRWGNMHGYKLNEFITRDLAYCSDIKKPTAYHLLKKMAKDGWIEEREEQVGNRPPRTIYQITAEGEQIFQQLLRENLASRGEWSYTGDAGLAFLDVLPPDETIQLLNQRLQLVQDDLSAIQFARTTEVHSGGAMQWVLEYKERLLHTEISWLRDVIQRLQTLNQEQ